ncbi:hypothetical protein Tco_0734702 [Tanacetum coccineum]
MVNYNMHVNDQRKRNESVYRLVLLELQRFQFILQDLHRLQFILQDLQHLHAILQELQHLKLSPKTSRNAECSTGKHLLDKITVLEATVDMYHTSNFVVKDESTHITLLTGPSKHGLYTITLL